MKGTKKMYIMDFLDRVEYSVDGDVLIKEIRRGNVIPEKNQITVCLMVTLKHFDRSMTVYGQEIEIEELKVRYQFHLTVSFDSLDIVKGEYSCTYHLEFLYIDILEMSDHESLVELVTEKIESDIRDKREIIIDEDSFNVVLKKS